MQTNQTQTIHFTDATCWGNNLGHNTLSPKAVSDVQLKQFTDLELVRYVASQPQNYFAWNEFTRRYHKRICYIAARTCRRLGYRTGLTQIEDLAQEVYQKLVKNNCEPLKTFKGEWEYSFGKFLEVVTTRTVYLIVDASWAKRRIPGHRSVSLSSTAYESKDDAVIEFEDVLESCDTIREHEVRETKEALECCLDSILKGKLHKQRDRRIFHLYFYESMPAEEIAERPEVNISRKRVLNRLTQIKKDIRPLFGKYIH